MSRRPATPDTAAVKRLPVWVQTYIKGLERERDDAVEQRRQFLSVVTPDTPAMLHDSVNGTYRAVTEYEDVEYTFGRMRIVVSRTKTGISIRQTDGLLEIIPSASNYIDVNPRHW